jgi:DNA-binding transcriptional LysR family regulator
LNRIGGMAFRLPPLSSLRVFEAAARHNSFRKAAKELNLMASAVSHGIQTLENWLGVELFYRETRRLRLTGAGEIYAPLVNQAQSIDSGLSVDTIQMGFDAAVRGLGVVLGRRPLVDGDIESGRLVRLASQTIPSGSGYWLVTSETEFQKPEVKLFRRWLLSELGAPTEHRKPAPSGSRTVQGRVR